MLPGGHFDVGQVAFAFGLVHRPAIHRAVQRW
jgi:hypothetical protein